MSASKRLQAEDAIREQLSLYTLLAPPIADDLPTVGRHFLGNTHFEMLTADAAKTRATAFRLQAAFFVL